MRDVAPSHDTSTTENTREDIIALANKSARTITVVAVPVSFVRLTGNIKRAYLLEQLLFLRDLNLKMNERDWFHNSYADWKEQTGMSTEEVRACVDYFCDQGFLETWIDDVNGKRTLHYRLLPDALREWIEERKADEDAPPAPPRRTRKERQQHRDKSRNATLQAARRATVDFANRWNRLVPSAPVKWHSLRDTRPLPRAFSDPEFVQGFDQICERAQHIHSHHAKDWTTEWLTFRWVVKDVEGRPNWWMLLTGGYDSMTPDSPYPLDPFGRPKVNYH